MFQNMVGMGNTSDKSSQHKLYTLKNNMINEGIAIIGLAEVISNWSKIPIKENMYNRRTDGLKQGVLAKDITKSPSPVEHFKAEAHISWR